MQIQFNDDHSRIYFISEQATEYSGLYKFPGLLKEGSNYYIPSKLQLAFNVIHRIQKQFKHISIEKSVLDFINSNFKLKELPPDFKFFTEPMPFQRIALRFQYTVESGGLLLAPGMGKSKVVLDYIALMKFKKSVIVCPKPLLFVWEDEVATHRPDLSIYVVGDLEKERIAYEEEVDGKLVKKYKYVVDREKAWAKELENINKAQVIAINYNKAVTFNDELRAIGFDFIHLDEFLIKDHTTERTKAVTLLSKNIPYRCGGSGTLINNTPLDMFAPVRYLEPSLVGGNFNHFQDRYTVRRGPKDSHIKFTVGFKNLDEARSILESCCIVMSKEEWLPLPAKIFHKKFIPMSDEQRRVYDELSRNYMTTFQGSTLEIDNALVMLSKLYQISNGFLYITKEAEGLREILPTLDGDKTEGKAKASKTNRETKYFPEQPKIEALNGLLDNELKSKKAIIWFNMEAEYFLIRDLLEKRGESFLTIRGGEKGTGDKVRLFNKTPSIRWLVCQAKSVNYGITVLGTSIEKLAESDVEALPNVSPTVSDEVFYSINYSLEVFLQQQDRIHRMGQKDICNYWILIANTSVEHSIREAIENKMTIREDMLVDIAKRMKQDSKRSEDFGLEECNI